MRVLACVNLVNLLLSTRLATTGSWVLFFCLIIAFKSLFRLSLNVFKCDSCPSRDIVGNCMFYLLLAFCFDFNFSLY